LSRTASSTTRTALGQALDVGDAAFDVDIEQRPAERRRGEACRAPGDQAKAHGGRDQADRHRAGETARRCEEHQRECSGGERRSQPQGGLARQFEVDRDAKTQRHRQPQHPAAAFGIELIQDPGTRPRHAVSPVPLFDSAGTLAYLRRAFFGRNAAKPART
jgi:hypothetical protein